MAEKMPFLFRILEPVAALLLVDFISGIFHWAEDSYGTERTPFFGRHVTRPNVIHHHDPRAFTLSPFLRRNSITFLLTFATMGVVFALFGFSFFALWVAVFGALSNEVHCWAHRSPRENGWFIVLLQKSRLIQSPRHHALHHTDPKRDTFCVLTDALNPILDHVHFFRGLEWFVHLVFRVRPRKDESVKAEANQRVEINAVSASRNGGPAVADDARRGVSHA
jgi:plasmanylethanolamine desaturase